jgi:hypothetical protein
MTTPRRTRTYLTLYFNVERAEDLDLLTLALRAPLTRRGTAVGSLRHLAAYLGAHHPDRPRWTPDVRDLVAARAGPDVATPGRARRTAAARARSSSGADPRRSSPGGQQARSGGLTDDADRAPSSDAEVRLDRLLRSFLR